MVDSVILAQDANAKRDVGAVCNLEKLYGDAGAGWRVTVGRDNERHIQLWAAHKMSERPRIIDITSDVCTKDHWDLVT